MVDVDLCGLRESLENRPCAVRRIRRRADVLVKRQQKISSVSLTSLLDCLRVFPAVSYSSR
jgi:hypothetical protein